MKTFKLKDLMVNIQPRQTVLSEHYAIESECRAHGSCSPPSSDCDSDTTHSCSPPSSDDCDDMKTSCAAPSSEGDDCDDIKTSCAAPSSDDCDDERTSCAPPSSPPEEKLNLHDELAGLDELKKAIAHLQKKKHTFTHAGESLSLN